MAGLRFTIKVARGRFTEGINDMHRPIALAATKGMRDLAEAWKIAARAQIRGAGFSKRFANAFRVESFPKLPKTSPEAAAFAHSKVGYAGVWERGDTISGTLWVPFSSTPVKFKRAKNTKSSFATDLFRTINQKPIPMDMPGVPFPVIGAKIAGRPGAKKKLRRTKKVSMAALKRGASPGGPRITVPLFHQQDTIRQKALLSFLPKIHRSFGNQIGKFYARNFRDK